MVFGGWCFLGVLSRPAILSFAGSLWLVLFCWKWRAEHEAALSALQELFVCFHILMIVALFFAVSGIRGTLALPGEVWWVL